MPTVEIAVDSRPMRQGVQEATEALDGLGKTAQRTTDAIQGVFAARQDGSGRAVDGLRFNYATLQEQVAKTTETVRFNYATMQDEIVKTTVLVDKNAGAFSGFGQAVSRSVQPLEQSALRSRQAIESVGQSAQKTTAQLRNAFQATGGSIQVAGGIAQTAKAFADLNVAAAAFGSSRALLEVGKTVQDFRELTNTTQEVVRSYQVLESVGDGLGTKTLRTINETVQVSVGRWSALGAIIKANPLLTIATVLGSIGSLMSIFSDNTKKAAESFEELGTAMSKARMDAATAAYLGVTGPGTQGQQQALFEAVGRARTTGAGINLQQFGTGPGQIGYGAQAARYLAQQGTPQQQAAAQEYLRTGGYQGQRYAAAVSGPYVAPTMERQFIQGLPDIQLSPQQTQEVLRSIYQQIVETSQQVAANTSQIYQFGAGGEVERQLPGVMGLPTDGRAASTAGYQTNLATGQLLPQYQVTPGEAPYYVGRPAVVTPAQPAPLPPAVAPGQAPYYLGGAQATGVVEFGAAGPEGGALQQSAMESARLQAEADRRSVEASEKVAQNMQAAADYAGNIGGQLGSAFADVLMKTTTLRQAFASLVASLARQGLSDVGASIFKGAVQGLTQQQASANAGVQKPA